MRSVTTEPWLTSAPATTEPASEPLLSRQWGLLSRFQQDRKNSGEQKSFQSAEDSDSAREPMTRVSLHRERQS